MDFQAQKTAIAKIRVVRDDLRLLDLLQIFAKPNVPNAIPVVDVENDELVNEFIPRVRNKVNVFACKWYFEPRHFLGKRFLKANLNDFLTPNCDIVD